MWGWWGAWVWADVVRAGVRWWGACGCSVGGVLDVERGVREV